MSERKLHPIRHFTGGAVLPQHIVRWQARDDPAKNPHYRTIVVRDSRNRELPICLSFDDYPTDGDVQTVLTRQLEHKEP